MLCRVATALRRIASLVILSVVTVVITCVRVIVCWMSQLGRRSIDETLANKESTLPPRPTLGPRCPSVVVDPDVHQATSPVHFLHRSIAQFPTFLCYYDDL
jgi:hypothetical protein